MALGGDLRQRGRVHKKIVLALNQEGIPAPGGGTRDLSAVREILQNEVYRGARAYGRSKKVRTAHGTRSKRAKPPESLTVEEGALPAIVSLELWERVAQLCRQRGMAQAQLAHSMYLLTGLLLCAACGGHFVIRGGYKTKAGIARHYACGRHTNRGAAVCPNRTHLPQARIEQEFLELLQGAVLAPNNLERLLTIVNARLRAQAAEARPRIKELKKPLAHVDREITNYTRTIGRDDFTCLETALTAAESRRATLQAECTRLEGAGLTAVLQLTPAALQHHLHGLIEELRSGEGSGAGERSDPGDSGPHYGGRGWDIDD